MEEVVIPKKGMLFYASTVNIEAADVTKLSRVLQHTMHIGELNLSLGYAASADTVLRFANALKNCASLKRLVISTEKTQSRYLQPLFECLSRIPGLQSLRIILKSHRFVTELTGLTPILERQMFLSSLDVGGCDLNQDSIIEIIQALCANTNLKSLNLSGNYLGGEATRALKSLVRQNKTIRSLNLSDGHMAKSELSRILSAITSDTALVELNLSHNALSELGVHYLLRGLAKNSQLTQLNLSQCSMTFQAMSVLLTELQMMPRVTMLSLSGYDFGKNNLNLLVRFIRQDSLLTSLDLSQCGLNPHNLLKILDELQCNSVLRKIDLSRNFFGDESGQLILDFLSVNKTLDYLSLNETKMSDVGLVIIAKLLENNTTLRQLYLRGNHYSHAGITVLLSALSQNTALFSLDLGESVEDKQALDYLVGFIPENVRIRALGFMPKAAQRTVDLLALYENACIANKFITDTHQDFSCQCGRCLCVKARKIVKWSEENKRNRYMNMALIIKAYLDPTEDHPAFVAFKKIPKDVLLLLFKLAYPELPPKTLSSVSRLLLFKPQVTASSPVVYRKPPEGNRVASVLATYLGVEISWYEMNGDLVLSFLAQAGNLRCFRHVTELCHQKIHTLLPYNNRYDIDFITPEPQRVLTLKNDALFDEEERLFKVAVMGAVCSGKTVLANRYVNHQYGNYFKASIGVDFKIKTIRIGNALCKVQLWDLAGTRPSDTHTHLYLRDANGIMLTVDLSRPQNYEETYQRILRETDFPNLPVLLVGLKEDICQTEDIKTFRSIANQLNLPCVIVSSRADENVDEAFNLLIKMMIAQKFPDYVLRLRIRKASQDWFDRVRFLNELKQLFVDNSSVAPLLKVYSYQYCLYEGAVHTLNTSKNPWGVCLLYLKNYHNEDEDVRKDARQNLERCNAIFPDLIPRIIKSFHRELLSQNVGIRKEAIEGLRVLKQLKTETVKNICLNQFRQIKFDSEYWLKEIIKKMHEYKKSDLARACIGALSSVHCDCFSILEEMGEKKICKDILTRVLQMFEEYVKRQQPAFKLKH